MRGTLSKSVTLIFVSVVFLLQAAVTFGQSPDRLSQTWKGPDLALIKSILAEDDKARSTAAPAKAKESVVKFTPAGDSGVARTLAEAFGRNPQEVATLKEAFDDIKKGYGQEVAKEGKSNNVAAALAFFIATNVMVYHDSAPPADEATEAMFNKLQNSMSSSPQFAKVTNAEKQQMHDWLVCVAGFALTNYQQAKNGNDAAGLKTIQQFAGYATQIVLGTSLDASVSKPTTPTSAEPAVDAKLVGLWSISASSPSGSSLGTNAGYSKGQYELRADGTYSFKSERWFGYLRSKDFYTTEESGTYSVSGNSLTISPKTSRTILRNPEGLIQETENNQLETVTYKWQLHFFEGINETNLVLQPPSETNRDGSFSSSSLFPNCYLYTQGSRLEWRF